MNRRLIILLGILILSPTLLSAAEITAEEAEAIKVWEKKVVLDRIFPSKVPLVKYEVPASPDTFGLAYSFYYPSDWEKDEIAGGLTLYTSSEDGRIDGRFDIYVDKEPLSQSDIRELKKTIGIADGLANYFYSRDSSGCDNIDKKLDFVFKSPLYITKRPGLSISYKGIDNYKGTDYYVTKTTFYCFIDQRFLTIKLMVAADAELNEETDEFFSAIYSTTHSLFNTLDITSTQTKER